jgi:predicted secreted protein
MAATIGKDGGVRIGSTQISFIDSWSLNNTIETVDVTSYSDSTRVRKQTFKEWTADVSGTLDRSDAQQAALLDQFEDGTLAEVNLRLYTGSSAYYAGSAILSGSSIESAVADRVNVSFSFQSAGDLSYTAS